MDNLAFARELAMALVGHFDIGHKETVGGLYRFEEATVETIAGVIQEYLPPTKADTHPDMRCGSCNGRLTWGIDQYVHTGPMFERHGTWPVEKWED